LEGCYGLRAEPGSRSRAGRKVEEGRGREETERGREAKGQRQEEVSSLM